MRPQYCTCSTVHVLLLVQFSRLLLISYNNIISGRNPPYCTLLYFRVSLELLHTDSTTAVVLCLSVFLSSGYIAVELDLMQCQRSHSTRNIPRGSSRRSPLCQAWIRPTAGPRPSSHRLLRQRDQPHLPLSIGHAARELRATCSPQDWMRQKPFSADTRECASAATRP